MSHSSDKFILLYKVSANSLWRVGVGASCPFPSRLLLAEQWIPLNHSPLVSLATALLSLPMRYLHKGQLVTGHRRTSALFPQQQSRHLSRIALPLVILSSTLDLHQSALSSSAATRLFSCARSDLLPLLPKFKG